MGPLPQTITIGAEYDSPIIRLTNADFMLGGVVMDRGVDFSGKALIIDDLTFSVRMSQTTAQGLIAADGIWTGAQGFLTVYGKAFLAAEGTQLLTQSGIPKDKVITGYVNFQTSQGKLFLTVDGRPFLVPVTQELDEFWEALFDDIPYGTPVWYEVNGKTYKFYWKNYRRTGKYEFSATAQSAVGLFDRPEDGDNGGMFDGITLTERIRQIIGSIVPYTTDPRMETVRVYGWQPVQSRRNALQDLVLAYGVIIRRDENSNLYFTLPPSGATEIPYGGVFLGGSVDRNDDKKYTRVDVTEHVFLETATDEEITLFDNTDGSGTAENLKVVFTQAPVYGIQPEGLTVTESNCNYAVVSGVGTLTGKRYTHITQTVSVDGKANPYADNVLSVTDAALVSYLNSDYVAARLRDYYNADVTVQMDFIRHVENPGDLLHFTDPYGKERTGYLTAVRSKATSFDRASASVVCGYEAKYWGNAYNAVSILTGSGTWTVPDSLDGAIVRVVLISGGQGGASGQHGTDDTASGGVHGSPGSGGKVYVIKMTVHAGETFRYRSGAGGAGGAPSGDYDVDEDGNQTYHSNPGSMGAPSTFGQYSSYWGAVPSAGYRDIIHRTQYAQTGPDNGVDGGAATSGKENNDGEKPTYSDVVYHTVVFGDKEWTSGGYGEGNRHHEPADEHGSAYDMWAYGGLGGGAAVGNDGGDGGDVGIHAEDCGGTGGEGADALAMFPEDTRNYGTGGSGGHGGGEGGPGGSGNTTEDGAHGIDGERGSGGSGSAGQYGKEGCILLYYRAEIS